MPAVMLLDEYSRRMQEMSKLYGEAFGSQKPEVTVVLNLENDIIKAIPALSEENAKLVCSHVYDLAMLSHKSLSADEMSAFIKQSVQILGIVAAKDNV
jgi:molecular chaperone HtpG